MADFSPTVEVATRGRHTRVASFVLFACAFAFLFSIKFAQERRFRLNDYDTGIYSNVAWNIAHGNGFHSGVLGRNHLGEHFSPITAVASPFYLISATPLWLLALQSAAVAAAFPLVLSLARSILPSGLSRREQQGAFAVLLLLMLLYRPLVRAHMFQFHPSTLGVPLVLGALLAMHRGHRLAYCFCVAVLLCTKELAVASVAGLAIYAWMVLRDLRLAVGTAVAAGLAGALIFGVVMPAFREEDWGHMDRLGPFADAGKKVLYVGLLLLGLGLLPMAGWRALPAVLPLVGVNLATLHEAQYSLKYHYDDQSSALLIVAAIHGMGVLLGRPLPGWLESRRGAVLSCGAVLVVGAASWVLGDAYVEQWRNIAKMKRSGELRRELAAYVDAPRTVAIATQSGLGPYLGHRDRYVPLSGDASDAPLEPGDLILLSPQAGTTGLDLDAARKRFANDPRAELLSSTDVLEVWRWRR